MTLKIMLDAGHGPNTPGKRSPDGSLREFHFNNRVADVMRAELQKYEGVSVYFAHESTRDVPLSERTNNANKLGVDVYVSLHANAGGGTGIETFVHPKSSAKSREIAKAVQAALIKATGMRDRGVKTADFQVLRQTKMPAVLIEHGFMDNASDLPKLKDDTFRVLCAKANVNALAQGYGLKRKGADQVANEAKVTFEGKSVPAFVQEGRTYVQVRELAELLGLQVGWNQQSATVALTKGGGK